MPDRSSMKDDSGHHCMKDASGHHCMNDRPGGGTGAAAAGTAGFSPGPRLAAALVSGILVMAALVSLVALLPPVSAPEVRMRVLGGDSIREVGYGESTVYNIVVENTGEGKTGLIELGLTDVPAYWNVHLSDRAVSLAANSYEIVDLVVTAPSAGTAAALASRGGLDHVASVGVRGGNFTLGTVTVLKGSLELLRDGNVTTLLSTNEPFMVESGDVLTAVGFATVHVDLSLFFNGSEAGSIYVGLHSAVVGFWREEDTAFMWVLEGGVALLGSGGSGGAAGVRNGQTTPGWALDIGRSSALDNALPDREYNAVLSFGPGPQETFISMDVEDTGKTDVAIFRGILRVENDLENATLTDLESMQVAPAGPLPEEPAPVRAVVVELEHGSSTEETILAGAENVYNLEDANLLIGVENRTVYIVPTAGQAAQDITITHRGNAPGEYRTSCSFLAGFTNRSFIFSTTSTSGTKDTLIVSGDVLELTSEERGKTYDLSITYLEKGMDEKKFEIRKIRTSKEKQRIGVNNWGGLTDAEDAVVFTEGDITVSLENGEDGDSLREKLDEEKGGKEDDTTPDPWIKLMVFLLSILILLLVAIIIISSGTAGRERRGWTRGRPVPPLYEPPEPVEEIPEMPVRPVMTPGEILRGGKPGEEREETYPAAAGDEEGHPSILGMGMKGTGAGAPEASEHARDEISGEPEVPGRPVRAAERPHDLESVRMDITEDANALAGYVREAVLGTPAEKEYRELFNELEKLMKRIEARISSDNAPAAGALGREDEMLLDEVTILKRRVQARMESHRTAGVIEPGIHRGPEPLREIEALKKRIESRIEAGMEGVYTHVTRTGDLGREGRMGTMEGDEERMGTVEGGEERMGTVEGGEERMGTVEGGEERMGAVEEGEGKEETLKEMGALKRRIDGRRGRQSFDRDR